MKKLLILLVISLFLMACGSSETKPAIDYSGKLTAKIKKGAMTTEKVTELTEKKGLFDSFPSSVGVKSEQVKVVFHQIYIANYELKDTNDEPTQKGQTMVKFTLFADKDAKEKDPIKVGTYEPFKSDDISKVNMTVSDVQVMTFEDAKDTKSISAQSPRTGSVKIESVTDGIVKGTIDLTELSSNISGNFTATLKK
mgnify:CR=1 FL=1